MGADRLPEPCPAAADLLPEQREVLLHTLGLNYDPPHHRNHYCAYIGGGDSPTLVAIRGLVERGLMAARRTINDGKDQYFTATEAGRQVARALLPPKPRLTRAEARYQRYLRVADVMTFRQFLAYETQGGSL